MVSIFFQITDSYHCKIHFWLGLLWLVIIEINWPYSSRSKAYLFLPSKPVKACWSLSLFQEGVRWPLRHVANFKAALCCGLLYLSHEERYLSLCSLQRERLYVQQMLPAHCYYRGFQFDATSPKPNSLLFLWCKMTRVIMAGKLTQPVSLSVLIPELIRMFSE